VYLSRLQIANFRGISGLTVSFHEGTNVLVGENTTCKTAVLDALRVCLGLGLERRDIYIQPEDFFTAPDGNQTASIQFDLTFADPKQEQQGVFAELLEVAGEGTIVLSRQLRRASHRARVRG